MLKSLQENIPNVPNPRTFFQNKGEEAKGAQYYFEKYNKELTPDDLPFLFDSEEEAKKLKKTILDGIPNTNELQKTRNFVDKLIGINKKQYKAPEETEAVDKYVVYGKKTKVLYNQDNWISNLFDAMKDSFKEFKKPSKYNFESWKTNIIAFKEKVIPEGVDIGQNTELDQLIIDNEQKVTSSGGTRRRKRGGRKSKAKKSSKNKTNKKRKRKGSKKSRK